MWTILKFEMQQDKLRMLTFKQTMMGKWGIKVGNRRKMHLKQKGNLSNAIFAFHNTYFL